MPAAPGDPAPAPDGAPGRFLLPDPDEPLLGYAAGLQDAQWRRLRRGRIRPDRSVDLHGLRRDPARRRCLAAIEAAVADGERCLLVVHGRGLRSPGPPRLRAALPDWLADPRLAGAVLGFAPARPEDGGPGATYVLLRRRRETPPGR